MVGLYYCLRKRRAKKERTQRREPRQAMCIHIHHRPLPSLAVLGTSHRLQLRYCGHGGSASASVRYAIRCAPPTAAPPQSQSANKPRASHHLPQPTISHPQHAPSLTTFNFNLQPSAPPTLQLPAASNCLSIYPLSCCSPP